MEATIPKQETLFILPDAQRNGLLRFINTIVLVVLFAWAATFANAQSLTGQGTIAGVVTDQTGASVPHAMVTIRNIDTNVSTSIKSNDTGYYEQDNINAGNYEVSVSSSGFEKLVRTGVVLPADGHITVDLGLTMGRASQVVTVNADAPLLETQRVSIGQVITEQEVQALPNGTSAVWLALLAPGVQTNWGQNFQQGGGTLSFNGVGQQFGAYGRLGANEFSLDGSPNNGGQRAAAINPHVDELSQVAINTTGYDATTGHTYGVSVIQTTKSGTNDLHGAVRERYDAERFEAMQHFQRFTLFYNRAKDNCSINPSSPACVLDNEKFNWPGTHENVPDASIGGPVFIPKLYDGRNKFFFFVSVVDNVLDNAAPATASVPTALERTGNFSDLTTPTVAPASATTFTAACGATAPYYGQYQLYNPYSVSIDSKGVPRRQPFCGNIIPSNLISKLPLVSMLNSAYPNPSSAAVTGTNLNYLPVHFVSYRAVTNRYDYALSESDHIFFRWTRAHYGLMANGFTVGNLDQNATPRWITTGATGWSHVLSPSTALNITVGATQYSAGDSLYPNLEKIKPSQTGLPAYVDEFGGTQTEFPIVSIQNYTPIGAAETALVHWRSLAFRGTVTSVRGQHSFQLGAEWRQQTASGGGPGNLSGTYAFDNSFVQQNNNTDGTYPTSTNTSYAAFLLGLNTSSTITQVPSYSRSTPYYSVYLGDTWRVSRKLTITPGVRYEFEYGPTEKHNRQIVGWDPDAPLAISGPAQNAYATTLTAALAAATTPAEKALIPTSLTVKGGPIYAGVNGASLRQWNNSYRILPRIGAAYQVNSTTVIRAGYGLFYDTLDTLSDNATINQSGFSSSTGPVSSSTTYGTNFTAGTSPLSDPFPLSNGSHFLPALGTSAGADYYDGSAAAVTIYDHNRTPARSNRFQVSVEHQFGNTMVVQVAYVGSRTTNITLNSNTNQTNTWSVGALNAAPIPAGFYAGGTQPNSAVNTLLSTLVPNPFYIGNMTGLASSNPTVYNILSKTSYATSNTIQLANLVRPYPQIAGLTMYKSLGTSQFQEFQANFSKRVTNGLTLNVAYQQNYQKDRDYFSNPFDTFPSVESSTLSQPYRLAVSSVYKLPFGRDMKWANQGWSSKAFGGFIFGGSYEQQPGNLLTFPNLFYVGATEGIPLRHQAFYTNYQTGSAYVQQFSSQAATATSATVNSITTCTYSGSGFVVNPACQPNAYNLRAFPTHVEGARQQGIASANMTGGRNFHLGERFFLETRVDIFNIFNHQRVGAANVTPTAAQFGQVTSDNGNGRTFTFGGVLRY